MQLDEIESILNEWRGPARPRTSFIALESPHNDHGGTIVPVDYIESLSELAHRHGCHLHMDGARIHNAAVATGVAVRRFTVPLDTVTISLNKGLGAPLGALLCGSAKQIEEARKRFKTLSDAAFDKAYIDQEVTYHELVLNALDKTLIPNAQNAELKALLVKVRPAFVRHLEHAKRVQSTIAE